MWGCEGKPPQHYHQNWLIIHFCHHVCYLACHLFLKPPFHANTALISVGSTATFVREDKVQQLWQPVSSHLKHALFVFFVYLRKGVLTKLYTWSTALGLEGAPEETEVSCHTPPHPGFQSFAIYLYCILPSPVLRQGCLWPTERNRMDKLPCLFQEELGDFGEMEVWPFAANTNLGSPRTLILRSTNT